MSSNHYRTISDEFGSHQEEAEILGRLIIGYGMIELAMWQVVRHMFDKDEHATIFVFARMGAEERIKKISSHTKNFVLSPLVSDELSRLIQDAEECREIRNKYAHSYYDDINGVLSRIKLEDEVKQGRAGNLLLSPLTLAELQEEETKFIRLRSSLESIADKVKAELLTSLPPSAV